MRNDTLLHLAQRRGQVQLGQFASLEAAFYGKTADQGLERTNFFKRSTWISAMATESGKGAEISS